MVVSGTWSTELRCLAVLREAPAGAAEAPATAFPMIQAVCYLGQTWLRWHTPDTIRPADIAAPRTSLPRPGSRNSGNGNQRHAAAPLTLPGGTATGQREGGPVTHGWT
jgi:hypothetical protein